LSRLPAFVFCFSVNASSPVPAINQAQNVPSRNAFLFSLSPFNPNDGPKKLKVLSDKRHQAIRKYTLSGPCWGEDKDELCFNKQQVTTEISASGVYDVSGISNPTTYFTGESSFQADDVEIFTAGGKNDSNSAYFTECTPLPLNL